MFYKAKLSSFSLLLAALLFAGCDHKDKLEPEQNGQEWPDGLNVYVAGFENVQNNPVARLWKNGEVHNLSSSSGSVLRSTGIIGSEARSIFVSGDDVYVAGYDIIVNGDNWYMDGDEVATNGDEVMARARLWKNGEMQNLVIGTFSSRAFSVYVSDDDVYVVGNEALEPETSTSKWAYKVWKNGEAEIFAEGYYNWQVNSLFVSNGDVYIAGRRTTPSGLQATLWKNGVEEDLVSESSNSCANFVFISGDDVYVAGYGTYRHAEPDNSVFIAPAAQLWKNGEVEKLSNEPQNAEALSVYVTDEGDVYVAGYDGDNARLWKNGLVQQIDDDKDARIYYSVFVKDNDVYLAGYVDTVKEVYSGGYSLHYFQASLWKNGKKINLTVGENDSMAYSVFVK